MAHQRAGYLSVQHIAAHQAVVTQLPDISDLAAGRTLIVWDVIILRITRFLGQQTI
jgi:hypothetical protein